MLEKYEIEVDMSESAEAAIDYLKHHRPDAIFMDHLMPGMDGLQAVKAIKGNPQTATIPIMMYTSQEGELYVGQARALGAMGVLPKQVRPVDVSKVLYELHLLPDRRDSSAAALRPVEIEAGAAAAASGRSDKASIDEVNPEWSKRIEASVRDQVAELRRFLVASLDTFATRISSDVREWTTTAPAAEPQPHKAHRNVLWGAALTAAIIGAVAFAALWAKDRAQLRDDASKLASLAAANADLRRNQQDLTESVRELSNALANAIPSGEMSAGGTASAAGQGVGPARTEIVPYGETALDRARVDTLREFLGGLESQGFRGTVRVVSYAGSFCLSGSGVESFSPAPPNTPLNKCDVIGNPFDEDQDRAERESVAFANLIKGARQRSGGGIVVTVEHAGMTRPAVQYPARSETTLAGDWNRAAAANNRVEFTLEPAS